MSSLEDRGELNNLLAIIIASQIAVPSKLLSVFVDRFSRTSDKIS
jgi:hypothetical protein